MSTPEPKSATPVTATRNHELGKRLNFENKECFDDAQRGFVGTIPNARIARPDGHVVWDLSQYEFLEKSEPPDSVNPSLWRQARVNNIHGLFEVTDGMYQVRGFDVANITIIEGKTGLIIIDPLMTSETAAAALKLYQEHRGERPIVAVIYSHSHPDHYGGAEGVVSLDDAASGKVSVIAPDGFLDEALSETILAGCWRTRPGGRRAGQSGATRNNRSCATELAH